MAAFEVNIDLSSSNFYLFKDCLASRILALSSASFPAARVEADSPDLESDLDDFTSYLATEAWLALPSSLRLLSHESAAESKPSEALPDLDDPEAIVQGVSISPSFTDTLSSYSLIPSEDPFDGAMHFLQRVLVSYIPLALIPPPTPNRSTNRKYECEICEREIPLGFHHLIPRSTHAKVLKRGWHEERLLQGGAWLCRACHSYVHSVEPNEVLAREYFTVERLLAREDIQRWRNYASKQRYGKRRG